MKRFLSVCFAMLLFVTASAFENGGKQKFERDRFVLQEHSQVQTIVFENQATFIPVVTLSAERPTMNSVVILIAKTQALPTIPPELFRNRDVGWQIRSGVNYNLSNTTGKLDNSPYKNYLRLYSQI